MDALNWIALQLFQPYFYYPLVLGLALYIAVNLAVRFTGIRDHRLRSHLFALPMLSPIFVYALYPPQSVILVDEGPHPFPFLANPMHLDPGHLHAPAMQSLFSITGSICISGILLGVFVLALCLALNRFGSRLGLIPLSEEDYPGAVRIVAKRCKRYGIRMPNIGLVEDLRPNAFVGGHGRSAVLVFSLGMLETFDQEELTVAIDHELMHLKNRDILFRSASIGLIALSFFNPIAYLSYGAALREREYLADDGSTPSKRSREALKSALRKAAETTSHVQGLAAASGLRFMGMVPLFPRNMLATHPAEEKRLESISRSDRERRASTKAVCLTLLCVVVLSGILLTAFVDTRTILVQGSPTGMLLGVNGHRLIDHDFLANAGPMAHDLFFQNMTVRLPPVHLDQADLSAPHFVNASGQYVATITASN